MKKFRNYISILFLLFAVSGIMLSMLHYHSEGLSCLEHAEEQHYTQNEIVCPVAGIIAVTGGQTQPSMDLNMRSTDIVVDVQPLFLSAQPFVPLLGRAPPFMI